MISPLWWIPLGVAAAGTLPLYLGTRRLADDLSALQLAISRLRSVRPELDDVTAEIRSTRRAVEDLARQ